LSLGIEELPNSADATSSSFDSQSIPPQVEGTAIVSEKPGDQIGGFTLLKEIGHGGFGVVYLAEQKAPVERRVALKVIKLGMDTKQVVARFEAERQAVALMDHPNIARVIDAGATATGRPYFVMELVGGIKITDYCEQNDLTTRQRLELFMQVCRAIQHAHQKGVIHRDIKPSNVLVATQDGVPVPKVIDFGIAKATQGKLTDDTVFTAFEQFLGTPAYMSPEQAQLGGLDVDTRSDIYSLGVLLYELLTGKTPFDAKELLAVGLEAMRRTICEKEPPTPSTRLKQDLAAQQAQSSGQSQIRNQKSKIENDLDWIVMKCLEKDRARRYETANGLARDIERHINCEPVVAGPPSNLYRFQKFVRRNKLMFRAATAVLTVLVLGVAASIWQAVRATLAEREQIRLRQQAQTAQRNEARERRKAQTEAIRSRQVAKFLEDMLKGVGPWVALGRDTTMLREILDKTAERVGKELANQPEVEIELRQILAETYDDLGLYKEMEAMCREELRLARAHFGEEHIATAHVLKSLADAQFRLSDYDQAENSVRAVLRIYAKLGLEDREVANAMSTLATVLHSRSKLAEAEAMHRTVLAMLRKLMGREHEDVAIALVNLSYVLWERGKFAEAEALSREALPMMRKLLGQEHPTVAIALNNLGLILDEEAKFAEAESAYRQALEMRRKLLGNEHPEVAQSLVNLAAALQRQGKLQEAEATVREAMALSRKRLGNEHRDVASELNTLASILEDQGKLVEAEAMNREALAMRRKLLGPDHMDIATSLNNLALILQAEGKLDEAAATHLEALAMRRKLGGDDHPDVAISRCNLAFALEEQGKLDEAEALYRETLTAQRKLLSNDHPQVGRTVNHLARVLWRQKKFAEVEVLCRDHLPFMRAGSAPDDPGLALLIAQLASALLAEGEFADAEPLIRESLAIREIKSPDDWTTVDARAMLGSSLLGQKRYPEAEPLLLTAFEGMKEQEAKSSSSGKVPFKKVLQELIQLYEAQGRSDQAAQWKQQLEKYERAQTNRVAPGAAPLKPPP
jgi:serine/threonine protein kinase/tetratricopeptide (TPR) repeat protein